MSSLSQSSHNESESSSWGLLLSVLGFVGTFLLFVVILLIAYIPNGAKPVDAALIQDRKAKLAALKADEQDKSTSYAWVDQSQGIVRIPITRAMDLVVESEHTVNP